MRTALPGDVGLARQPVWKFVIGGPDCGLVGRKIMVDTCWAIAKAPKT
jgi:S-adenosylmethionine synthetase